MRAKLIASIAFVLLGAGAQLALRAQGKAQEDTARLLRALEDPKASVREKATRRIASEVGEDGLGTVLGGVSSMSAETMRRVARALGQRVDLLGGLARRLEAADAGAGLAARALHAHFAARALPLPDRPDTVDVLPDEDFELRGLESLVDFVDALLVSGRLELPIILEPSLALEGSPAR